VSDPFARWRTAEAQAPLPPVSAPPVVPTVPTRPEPVGTRPEPRISAGAPIVPTENKVRCAAARDLWLASIARSIRAALADGAVRVVDEDGWLLLARPDGRRTVVAPGIVAQIADAGLLPALPGAVGEQDADDPDAAAERAAIQGEPSLPPVGSPEREAADRRQAEAIAGLLAAALSRPPGWSDVRSVPPPGAWCSCCGRARRKGGQWWREAVAPTGWRCATCHPPDHLREDCIVRIET
jgi:hypothetical protein